MPPKRLTEEELQALLGHVKVRVDPGFNRALQAELRARAQELRQTSPQTSRQQSRPDNPSARVQSDQVQSSYQREGLWRFSTVNILSAVVFATAALAFVFLVLIRPLMGGEAVEPGPTDGLTGIPVVQTITLPADSTSLPTPTDPPPPTPAPTENPIPTPLPTPTSATPTPTETMLPTPAPTWTPTTESNITPSATPLPENKVTCSWTQVSGYVELSAPYVRVTVSTAAFPITQIGEATGQVSQDGSYSVTVSYPIQPAGTRLIVSYGEWDGASWLRPATLFGADCTEG